MGQFRSYLNEAKISKDLVSALVVVNTLSRSTWGRKDSACSNLSGYNYGVYEETSRTRTSHFEYKKKILSLYVNLRGKSVIARLSEEKGGELVTNHYHNFTIKSWNNFVKKHMSNLSNSLMVNSIGKKIYSKIVDVRRFDGNTNQLGEITFDNGFTVGIYKRGSSAALEIDSVMEKFKIFKADSLFEKAFPNELFGQDLRKQLRKIKPKKLSSYSNRIPSSAHVSGTSTVTVYEYNINSLLKKYQLEQIIFYAKELFIYNPRKQSLSVDKNKIYVTSKDEVWYD